MVKGRKDVSGKNIHEHACRTKKEHEVLLDEMMSSCVTRQDRYRVNEQEGGRGESCGRPVKDLTDPAKHGGFYPLDFQCPI